MDQWPVALLLTPDVLISVSLVAAALPLRALLVRLIRSESDVLSDRQRRWIRRVRGGIWLVVVLGLAVVWAPALRAFALSLTAVTVAIVIATKELLLCLSGAVLRATTQAYAVGDWIEVGTFKGEVTDYGLLATALQEIDVDCNTYEYTGRTLIVPNSLLLTTPVRNENFMRRYVFHRFQVHLEPGPDVATLEALILDRVRRDSAGFAEVARRYNASIRRRTGVAIMGPEPRVLVATTELAKLCLTVTVFCPTKAAASLEQAITRDVLRAACSRVEAAVPGDGSAGATLPRS